MRGCVFASVSTLALSVVGIVGAQAQTFSEFTLPNITRYQCGPGYVTNPANPRAMTLGADGNVWFLGNQAVLKMASAGVASIVAVNSDPMSCQSPNPLSIGMPTTIAPGTDGSVWITAGNAYPNRPYRYPAASTVLQINPYSVLVGPASALTAGPDNAMWYTTGSTIVREGFDGTVQQFPVLANMTLSGIALGPDNALWFTAANANFIGRMPTTGSPEWVPALSANAQPGTINQGPDGAMWFTEPGANKIGRIDMNGNVTEYAIPTANASPVGMMAGPDNAMWFAEQGGNKIAKIDMSGHVTEYAVPTANAGVSGLTVGPDGAIWFTETNTSKIGRFQPASPSLTVTNNGATHPAPISFIANFTVNVATSNFLVNFGDGTTGALTANFLNYGCPFGQPACINYTYTASHSYANKGVYTAKVINQLGQTVATQTVTVK